ncbi:MAG TPA: phosphoribosylanthranilate isomerase [Verrucomicrobiae bacterium]|nr:phosphoribosylanthranilate isomerase [Verrucomicrobiae bacterium]
MRVKICGITNWADAKAAIHAGADALGFNFYAKSPRKISVSHARDIIRHMPKHVSAVGVFVNAAPTEVLRTAKAARLKVVQLHGDETPLTVSRLSRDFPVIKAFRVGPNFRAKALQKYGDAAAFLLDGFDAKWHGGTGHTFDWRIATDAKQFGPIILAGGLKKENVGEAIREVQPFAVDVCSGVEAAPGKKDIKKLRGLMAAVRDARGKRK